MEVNVLLIFKFQLILSLKIHTERYCSSYTSEIFYLSPSYTTVSCKTLSFPPHWLCKLQEMLEICRDGKYSQYQF